METFMHLSSEYGSVIYRLMYILAFTVTISIFIYSGFRAGYPKKTWLWITLCGVVFFILGNKLLTNTPEQLFQFFQDFQLVDTGKRSLLGGLLGLLLGLYLGAKWLRVSYPFMDKLAIAIPAGIAITRIGCLFAGCCFGEPTHLPWGLTYDAATLPGHIQLSHELIHSESASALPVHPVQLYEAISCVFIIILVWCTRKRWKANGSKFLFMLGSYTLIRFILEFLRDPSTDGYLGGYFLGIKGIQWALILAWGTILTLLLLRERKREFKMCSVRILPTSYFHEWALFIIFTLFLISARKWLEVFEVLTILIVFIPVSLQLLTRTYNQILNRNFRRIAPLLFAGFFILTAQTLPDEGEKIVYTEIGLGYMTGIYKEAVKKFLEVDYMACDHYKRIYSNPESHSYNFNTIGFQYSRNQIQSKYRRMGYGFGGNGAWETEKVPGMKSAATNVYFGINGYFKYDWRGFGLLGGLQAGYFDIAAFDRGSKNLNLGEEIGSPRIFYLLPQFSLRLGPYDILFFKADFFNHFPSASPMPLTQFGIGSGLGKTNGTSLSAGYSLDAGLYTHLILPIKEKFIAEVFYADAFASGIKDRRMLSVAFHYRFNYKTVPKKRQPRK